MVEEFSEFMRITSAPPPSGGPPGQLSTSSMFKMKSGLEMMQMAKQLREYMKQFEPKVVYIDISLEECQYCGCVTQENPCGYCGT